MSAITGRTPEGIQAIILAGLVGQTLTGTYLTCLLNQAEDDQDPGVGAYEAIDGGVAVLSPSGQTLPSASRPQTTGGSVQRRHAMTFKVRVTYAVGGVVGQKLATDTASFLRQIVNLIETTLEPQAATDNYDVEGLAYGPAIRHPRAPGFYLQEISVTVRAWWART